MTAECKFFNPLNNNRIMVNIIRELFSTVGSSSARMNIGMGGESGGQKGTNHNVRQFKRNQRVWCNKITGNRAKGNAKYTEKNKLQTSKQAKMQKLNFQLLTSTVSSLWKDIWGVWQMSYFWALCRSNDGRTGTMHDVGKGTVRKNKLI